MRIVSVAALAAGLAIGLTAPVSAASVDDLVNLRANGLSEELLVALVETDGSSFDLSPDDVLALHRRGLGDRLIAAMLKTAPRRPDDARARHDGRTSLPGSLNHHQPPVAAVVSSVVAVPAAVVAVPAAVVAEPAVVVAAPAVVVAAPVVIVSTPPAVAQPYWGFGGRLRPGSWDPR